MAILSDAESRSFSQFLDSIDSPLPHSSLPPVPPTPALYAAASYAHGTEKLAGMRRLSDAGGPAPLGGWAAPGGGGRARGAAARPDRQGMHGGYGEYGAASAAQGTGVYGGPPSSLSSFPPYSSSAPSHGVSLQPHPSHIPLSLQPSHHPYPSTTRHALYSSASSASAVPLGFAPISSSYPPAFHPPPAALSPRSAAEQKRQRRAQQAEELEAMLRSSSREREPKARGASYAADHAAENGGEWIDEDADGEEDEEDEPESPPFKRSRSDDGLSQQGQQADPLLLMLEAEKASAYARSSGGFAPPQPPQPRLHLNTTEGFAEPKPVVRAPQKRKAPAATRSAAVAPPGPHDPGASSSLNPAPAPTPANIPPAPHRTTMPRYDPPPKASASVSPPPPANGKGALLTPAQKKANHIASEQKRRAAIRAGYDQLCVVVPPLREAVQEYETRLAAVSRAGGGGGKKGKGTAGRGKKGESTTGALMGGIQVGGEKIDGRAGPKSEAVVLSKTVEHLRLLLSTRSTLLSRLSAAHLVASQNSLNLPPAPPAGAPEAPPLSGQWDEEWAWWMEETTMSALGLASSGDARGEEE
ncbi:hypothetical protein JCM10213_003965 [Rhodosporidiobolus nylandii]